MVWMAIGTLCRFRRGSVRIEARILHNKPSGSNKNQTCSAADELQMAIVTGHTGTYEDLSALTGVCTAYGTVDKDRLLTPRGAKAGDLIFCVKPVGLETIVNFALTHVKLASKLLGTRQTQKLSTLVHMQSCVKEALLIAKTKGAHAMHDATEGGLTAALNEIADASEVGFEIDYDKIPIPEEMRTLQQYFRLRDHEVLSTSSTGTILVAVSPEAEDVVEDALSRNSIEANILGCFVRSKGRFLMKNSRRKPFPKNADDPYQRILSEKV
jgi:hydrogenase expression/formation protein HypE